MRFQKGKVAQSIDQLSPVLFRDDSRPQFSRVLWQDVLNRRRIGLKINIARSQITFDMT